ncbi:sigma-70 family RNA polymerase sigma factor [Bacillus sp. FJAT-45066]|uniref:sigma-70 family RNA polymerase sigma factor n=1 Tax=Bacillus sp. FJAT-45066 TaxID=2011010 RepID=UPI000BB85C42|nr:sigma-70 family RNA polymerase sigma factor [Bacillus sp. FJAT-45066]
MRKERKIEDIYMLYMKDLFRYIYSLCKNKEQTEDIVQETFYRVYIYIDSYKGEEIKPWLFKIAYNTFIDTYRKESRMTYLDAELLNNVEKSIGAEQQFFQKHEVSNWLKEVHNLSIEKRNAVILRDYHSFSYQEISELLDLSLSYRICMWKGALLSLYLLYVYIRRLCRIRNVS